MRGDESRSDYRRQSTRRRILSVAVGALASGLAGCSGNGDPAATQTTTTIRDRTTPDSTAAELTPADGGEPAPDVTYDFGPYLEDGYLAGTSNYDGDVVDLRGETGVSITVGADTENGLFGFDPPAVRVSAGTEVVWQWPAEGGTHQLASGDFDLGMEEPISEGGHTLSHIFTEPGRYRYACLPHATLGGRGVVIVGDPPRPDPALPRPAVEDHLADANGYDGTVTYSRVPDVTIEMDGERLAFDPPVVQVPVGGNVSFQWPGQNQGEHNVVSEHGSIDSGPPEAADYSLYGITPGDPGIYRYECEVHGSSGMRGAIVVGSEYPAADEG